MVPSKQARCSAAFPDPHFIRVLRLLAAAGFASDLSFNCIQKLGVIVAEVEQYDPPLRYRLDQQDIPNGRSPEPLLSAGDANGGCESI